MTLEPFFAGTLFSAETLTWHGETRLLAVSGRVLGRDWRFREEAVVAPVKLSNALTEDIRDYVRRVLEAIGYDRGFSHTEFVMTKGGFQTVEVNPRLGGSLLGEILSRSFGYNVYRAHLDLALDQRPELLDMPLKPKAGLAQIFMFDNAKRVFRGVSGVNGLTARPGSPRFF